MSRYFGQSVLTVLILLVLPQASRILIGYWLAQQLLAVCNQQLLNMTFHCICNGKNKLSITEESRLLSHFESTRSQCTTVSTTQLLILLYSVCVRGRGRRTVCAELLRAKAKCTLRETQMAFITFRRSIDILGVIDTIFWQDLCDIVD